MSKNIWKQISHFDNYEVSNVGSIRNKSNKKILKPHTEFRKNKNGEVVPHRVIYNLKNNDGIWATVKCHRIVALHHLKVPLNYLKLSVDHKDRNVLNNNVNNLRWATIKEQELNKNTRRRALYPSFGVLCVKQLIALSRLKTIPELSKIYNIPSTGLFWLLRLLNHDDFQ